MAHVAGRACQRFPDKNSFYGFEAELVEILTRSANLAEPKVAIKNAGTTRHENGAFDGVIELAHIARPGMLEHGFERARLKAANGFPVAGRVSRKKVAGEQRDIFAALPQRR